MDLMLKIFEFFENNGIIALFISIIIAFLELVLLVIRTRKSKLEKEFLKINDFNYDEYVVLYNNKEIPLNDIQIKKKGGI